MSHFWNFFKKKQAVERNKQIIQLNNNNTGNFSFIPTPDQYLPNISEEKINNKDVVVVDITTYEELMNSFLGCELSNIPLEEKQKPEIVDTCKIFVRRYSNGGLKGISVKELADEIFGGISEPSAMLFKNTDEMSKSVFKIYQISYAHYVLGRYHCMKDMFPNYCCGFSSDNLTFSLWDAGIISAVSARNSTHDHTYVIVPFIIQETNVQGVIIVDPTSDQLTNYEEKKVRNLIMVTTKERWSYVTDWRNGANLYPELVGTSACYGEIDKPYTEYLGKALSKPVIVT